MRPTASGLCLHHDPAAAEARREGNRRGAEVLKARRADAAVAAALPPSSAPVEAMKLDTADQIHRCLAEAINAVRLGSMTPTAGNVVGSLCRAALTALEVKLLEQLEHLKDQQEQQAPRSLGRRARR